MSQNAEPELHPASLEVQLASVCFHHIKGTAHRKKHFTVTEKYGGGPVMLWTWFVAGGSGVL